MTLAVASLLAALAVSFAVTRWVVVTVDEAWFLQVAWRHRRGDRLYSQVFFGAGPLPVWLASLAVRATRPQIVVMRALALGYGLATVAAGMWVLRAVGAPSEVAALYVLAAVALGGHQVALDGHYGLLSTLGVVLAAGGVITGGWAAAGVGVLLALSGKYTLGAAAAAWVLPLLAASAGVAAAAWAIAVVAAGIAALGMVLGREGIGAFVAGAVANKAVFLRTAVIRPQDDLRRLLARAEGRPPVRRVAETVIALAVFGTAAAGLAAALGSLAAGVFSGSIPLLLAAGLCFTGLAVAYPRSDLAHLAAGMPLVVLGLLLIAEGRMPQAGSIAAAALCFVVLAAGTVAARLSLRPGSVRRDLPHLRLLPVTPLLGVWPDDTDAVHRIAGDEVFVLRRDAAFFYLAGQLTNPTPYDYPLATTFGRDGQDRVAAAIARGEVAWVCWPGPIGGPMAPTIIEQQLAATTPAAGTAMGALYRAGGSEAGEALASGDEGRRH